MSNWQITTNRQISDGYNVRVLKHCAAKADHWRFWRFWQTCWSVMHKKCRARRNRRKKVKRRKIKKGATNTARLSPSQQPVSSLSPLGCSVSKQTSTFRPRQFSLSRTSSPSVMLQIYLRQRRKKQNAASPSRLTCCDGRCMLTLFRL